MLRVLPGIAGRIIPKFSLSLRGSCPYLPPENRAFRYDGGGSPAAVSSLWVGMLMRDLNSLMWLRSLCHSESGSHIGRNRPALYVLSVLISRFLLHALSK